MAGVCPSGELWKFYRRLGQRFVPRQAGGSGQVRIPEHLKDEWWVWRLILSGKATLKEIDSYYDVVEAFDILEALDLQEEAERRAHEQAARRAQRR